jgi:hypothetical protein
VGVGKLDVHGLLVVGGGVLVAQQEQVGEHPVAEADQVEVELEPPGRVFGPEQQDQHDGQEEEAAGADRSVAEVDGGAAHQGQDNENGQDGEDAKGDREAVPVGLLIVDREVDRVGIESGWLHHGSVLLCLFSGPDMGLDSTRVSSIPQSR